MSTLVEKLLRDKNYLENAREFRENYLQVTSLLNVDSDLFVCLTLSKLTQKFTQKLEISS